MAPATPAAPPSHGTYTTLGVTFLLVLHLASLTVEGVRWTGPLYSPLSFGLPAYTYTTPTSPVLSQDDVRLMYLFALAYLAWYAIGRSVLRFRIASQADGSSWGPVQEAEWRKRRAWLVGCLASLCTSVVGVAFIAWMLAAPEGPVAYVASVTRGEPWVSRPAVLLFLTSLPLDLLIGWFEYPEHISVGTGWVHHTAYCIIIPWILEYRITGSMAVAIANEVPTAMLALGTLDKSMRTDLPFGIVYFLTRILLDAFAGYVHYTTSEIRPLWVFSWAIMGPHILWFRAWTVSYGKKLRADKEKRAVAAAAAAGSSKGGASSMPEQPPRRTKGE
jgi:hypothetical protein